MEITVLMNPGLTHFRKLQDFRNFSTHFHYPCEWPRTGVFFLPPPGLLMVVSEEKWYDVLRNTSVIAASIISYVTAFL